MRRSFLTKNENKSVAKKQLKDELSSLNVARNELSSIYKEIKEGKKSLVEIEKKEEKLSKDFLQNGEESKILEENIILIKEIIDNKTIVEKQKNSEIVALDQLIIERKKEVNHLDIIIFNSKNSLDSITDKTNNLQEKEDSLIKSIKESEIKEKSIKADIKIKNIEIEKHSTILKKKKTEIIDLDLSIHEINEDHEKDLQRIKEEKKVAVENLKYSEKEYEKKKEEINILNEYKEKVNKELSDDKKELEIKSKKIEEVGKELKRKWGVMQRGENKEEIKNFFD